MTIFDQIMSQLRDIEISVLRAQANCSDRIASEHLKIARKQLLSASSDVQEHQCMGIAKYLEKINEAALTNGISQEDIDRMLNKPYCEPRIKGKAELGVVHKKGFIIPAKLQRK